MISETDTDNYETFRDCLSELIISKLSHSGEKKRRVKGRKNEIKPVVKPVEDENASDAEELGDFIDVCSTRAVPLQVISLTALQYLASEIFASLPPDLRTISYSTIQNDTGLAEVYSTPLDTTVYDAILDTLPPSVADSLTSYSLLPPTVDMARMLEPVFTAYIISSTTPPPEHSPTTRATECEICEREYLPLTYHHLIPRQMHAKAVKRGWVKEWELQKVAWLCRACHSFVHRIAGNEELAREWHSVEVLMGREDVQAWAKWVGRIRWKKS